MEVTGWLLIVLSVLSGLLLLLFLLFLLIIIKNYLRRRRYDQINPKGKNLPGKLMACFKVSEDVNSAIIPKTFPAVMQTGNPLFSPSWKVVPYTGRGSVSASTISSNVRAPSFSSKFNDPHSFQPIGEGFRKSSRNGPSTVEMRKLRSPLTVTGECHNSQHSSRSGSIAGEINKGEELSKNTPPEDNHQVYLHSDFFIDVDNSTPFTEDDPVISYDQQDYHASKSLGPGSLFFVLEYNVPELLVTIKSGLDLPPTSGDVTKPFNSYVNFCLVPEDFLWQRTCVVLNDTNPVYNETFTIHDVLYHKLREYTLCFFIMDCTTRMGERVIGKVLYPLSDLRAEDRVEVCKELAPP